MVAAAHDENSNENEEIALVLWEEFIRIIPVEEVENIVMALN